MLKYKNINLDKYFDGTCLQSYDNEEEICNDLGFIIIDYERGWKKASDHYVNLDVAIDNWIDYVHDKCEYYYDKVNNYYRYTDKQYYYNKAQLKKHTINYVILQQMIKFYE